MLVGHRGDLADMRYGCGFTPVDPMILLDTGTEQHLIAPLLEVGRAHLEAPAATIHTPQSLGVPKAARRKLGAWAVALARKQGCQRVRVPAFFPAGLLLALQRAGVRVRVEDGAVYPQRAIKRDDEVARIAEAQRAAVAAMRAAIALIRQAGVDRKGQLTHAGRVLTSEAVKRVIEETLLRLGCQSPDTIVSSAAQAAEPHHRGTGPLRAGESIVLDIFPQHNGHGYWGDITRTVVKGAPRPELRRMYDTVRRAQARALQLVKPGARADHVHQTVQAIFSDAGYVTETRNGQPVGFFHGTGHGVGLDIHEAPSLSTVPVTLQPGHVVTVEPGLYDPDIGGVRIEDTVVVTRDGCRILCPFPKSFEV